MKKRFYTIGSTMIFSLLFLFFVTACNNEDDNLSKGETARIQLKLTDAPALEYDEVNIDIQGVKVGVAEEYFYTDDPYLEEGDEDDADESDDVVWVDLKVSNPGLYNLLDYRNGETVLLAGGDIPAGKISQVRLILGEESNVVIDGELYSLQTPSAQTSGLKFNLHDVLQPNMMYSFVIDFDASRSVVETGNNKYILKPVIRTYADAYGGSIKGTVVPADSVNYVQLVSGEDTLISLPEDNGLFLFAGLEEKSWNLTVFADTLSNREDTLITDIGVEEGVVVDLGEIQLPVKIK
jgi:hypothetical protein